jgi:hypothetical protein
MANPRRIKGSSLQMEDFAQAIHDIDEANNWMLSITLTKRLYELIGDTVPYLRTLKPVTSGTDYWDRRRRITEALDLARVINALGGSELCRGCPVQDVRSALAFLEFQRCHYMDSWESWRGPEDRVEVERQLAELRPDVQLIELEDGDIQPDD